MSSIIWQNILFQMGRLCCAWTLTLRFLFYSFFLIISLFSKRIDFILPAEDNRFWTLELCYVILSHWHATKRFSSVSSVTTLSYLPTRVNAQRYYSFFTGPSKIDQKETASECITYSTQCIMHVSTEICSLKYFFFNSVLIML